MPQPRNIVAFGDSVTKGVRAGVNEYQTFRHLLQEDLKTRGLDVKVVNAGVGGHNTAMGLARIDADVIENQPELVIVMFGVNDAAMVDGGPVARTEPRVSLADYVANLREIVRRCREAGASVVLCTPSPMSRAYAYYQVRVYAQAVRDLAEELDAPLVDAFELFDGRDDGLELIEDGCHPYVEGHRIIADAMLEPVAKMLTSEE